jgi:hypothetical protein
MLGIRRTSVTLLAQDLQRQDIIKYSRGKIAIMNRPALETCACECYRTIKEMYRDLSGHTQEQPSGHAREDNEYVARAAVCEQRAKDARTENEKQSWLVMADSWRKTVKLPEMLTVTRSLSARSRCRARQDFSHAHRHNWHQSACDLPIPMRFAPTVPKVGNLPEMETFECRLCRLAVTAEQVRSIMEMVSL